MHNQIQRPFFNSIIFIAIIFLLLPKTALSQEDQDAAPKPNQGQESKINQMVQDAGRLFRNSLLAKGADRKRFQVQSFNLLEKAVSIDPSLPPAGVLYAKLLIAAGDNSSARKQLLRSTLEDPNDPEAYTILGNIDLTSGNLTGCRLYYYEAERLANTLPETSSRKKNIQIQIAAGQCALHRQHALQLIALKKPKLAAEHNNAAKDATKRWSSLEPKSTKPHIQLAQILLGEKKIEEAEDAYKKAVEVDQQLIGVDLWMANYFVSNGQSEKARLRIEQAVKEAPENDKVKMFAGGLFLSLGMPKKAFQQIDAALALAPKNRTTRFLLAQYFRFEGKWDKATTILQKLNDENADDFETSILLSLNLTENGTKEQLLQAIALAAANTNRFPDPTSAQGRRSFITLCWAYHCDQQTDKAREVLNQLLKVGIRSDKINADEAYIVARLLNEFNQSQLAAPLLENILGRKTAFAKQPDAQKLLEKLKDNSAKKTDKK